MHLTTFKSDKKSGQFWSVDQYKKGCKGREIRKEVHIYDEYAKNDETSSRLAKKYENCAS